MSGKPQVPVSSCLTPEQVQQVVNLLENGGGVTYSEIALAIEYEPATALAVSDSPGELELYLLRQIALGNVRRVWNKDMNDHFYMVAK
jgi:hypothetical protein